MYLLDDHNLIVYIPWTFLVFVVWYCLAWRLQAPATTWQSTATIVLMQTLITAELVSVAVAVIAMRRNGITGQPIAGIAFFCAWSTVAMVGWIDLFRRAKTQLTG